MSLGSTWLASSIIPPWEREREQQQQECRKKKTRPQQPALFSKKIFLKHPTFKRVRRFSLQVEKTLSPRGALMTMPSKQVCKSTLVKQESEREASLLSILLINTIQSNESNIDSLDLTSAPPALGQTDSFCSFAHTFKKEPKTRKDRWNSCTHRFSLKTRPCPCDSTVCFPPLAKV